MGTVRHRILIVDDYPDAAETSCVLFELLGHECVAATSGHAALAAASELDPDIVLLDLGLPDLSGFEVARALRDRETPAHPLYIAAVTGWGQPADRERALAAGFDQHVVKPTDREKFMGIIDAAEQKARARLG